MSNAAPPEYYIGEKRVQCFKLQALKFSRPSLHLGSVTCYGVRLIFWNICFHTAKMGKYLFSWAESTVNKIVDVKDLERCLAHNKYSIVVFNMLEIKVD